MEHLQQTDLSKPMRPLPRYLASLLRSFSTSGLLVGVIFFAVSLTRRASFLVPI
ncbi:putative membrane protein [Sinorhizobium fredii]